MKREKEEDEVRKKNEAEERRANAERYVPPCAALVPHAFTLLAWVYRPGVIRSVCHMPPAFFLSAPASLPTTTHPHPQLSPCPI